ncbi:hypothetical protein SBF1_460012 [Candidatus Desulfosporosinus infrequens]|uniref:Uncharacterized protein n=1 Tax=Candidatus Desulfosporosinus infrequens TaxID=2043169 RepID=A0A2U3LCM8_9FIRM|nr:hypothetical protein SBF1_460012 [Candidatus Desulfosporosinus infrequens]
MIRCFVSIVITVISVKGFLALYSNKGLPEEKDIDIILILIL